MDGVFFWPWHVNVNWQVIIKFINKTLLHLNDGSEHQSMVSSYLNVRPGSRDWNDSFNKTVCGKEKASEVVVRGDLSQGIIFVIKWET